MDEFRINLQPTLDLHRRIESIADSDSSRVADVLDAARAGFLIEAPGDPGKKRTPGGGLSALQFSHRDIATLERFSVVLHGLVEKILDRVVRSEELVKKYFPEHLRILPWLTRGPGSENWQLVSRYDFMLSPEGTIQLLELNTGCPGGFMVVQDVVTPTVDVFRALGLPEAEDWESVNMMPGVIVDTVLDLENKSGIEPGLVAVLNDENGLMFEMEQTVAAFRKRGRDSRLIDARALRYEDGKLYHEGDYISASYNKFRISTPDSPNHCWKAGFEQRYAAFLAAQKENAFVSVNNICGMSIAEDKGLIGLFFEPEFQADFTDVEMKLVAECVPWTARLKDASANYRGHSLPSLTEYVRNNKDRFVIKPANEGRGFGVLIGRETSDEEWSAACEPDPILPCIVQEVVDSVSLRIGNFYNGGLSFRPTYMTVAVAMADGRPKRFVSRASTEAVTNVAKHGFVQAIFASN